MESTIDYKSIDPVVLYDIFYETGTRLGGTYVALMRKARADGDLQQERDWRDRHQRLNNERRAVNPEDTEDQIKHIHDWDALMNKLDPQLT